jgi:zinc transporter
MNNTIGIIHGCVLQGDGSAKPIDLDRISEYTRSKELSWVHLDQNVPETKTWLEQEVGYLDSIIIDALLAEETRPRILHFENGALLILRGVNLNENAEPEDMVSIRLWIDESRIVSVRKRRSKAVMDIHEQLLSGKGPKNSGEFIVMLLGRLFERMEPVFAELDDSIDSVEEEVMESPDAAYRQGITDIRKQAILFKRYIAPQRDVISALRTSDLSWLSAMDKRRLQETLDRVIRYIEDIDTIRERAQIVKDELANALSDRMNKNLYILSVIAAIFLPLGFLTGMMGINVGGMPGVESENAFWIFAVFLATITGVQVILFKWLKWF